jgi:hypothetical protein
MRLVMAEDAAGALGDGSLHGGRCAVKDEVATSGGLDARRPDRRDQRGGSSLLPSPGTVIDGPSGSD